MFCFFADKTLAAPDLTRTKQNTRQRSTDIRTLKHQKADLIAEITQISWLGNRKAISLPPCRWGVAKR